MNHTAQLVIVYAIVAVAALYAIWRIIPGVRTALAPRVTAWLRRLGVISADKAELLETRFKTPSGCGSCDSCGGCAPRKPGEQHTDPH